WKRVRAKVHGARLAEPEERAISVSANARVAPVAERFVQDRMQARPNGSVHDSAVANRKRAWWVSALFSASADAGGACPECGGASVLEVHVRDHGYAVRPLDLPVHVYAGERHRERVNGRVPAPRERAHAHGVRSRGAKVLRP